MGARNEEIPLGDEILGIEQRVKVYDALVTVLRNPHELLEVLTSAEDTDRAVEALRDRYGFDDQQARAVLDTQFRRTTKQDLARILRSRDEDVEYLSYLETLAADRNQ